MIGKNTHNCLQLILIESIAGTEFTSSNKLDSRTKIKTISHVHP